MSKILDEFKLSNSETIVMGTSSITSDDNRLKGYYFVGTGFNLSYRLPFDNEVTILEIGLNFILNQFLF